MKNKIKTGEHPIK